MRKLGLLVTLMVASALFLGAAPGSASAANCTAGMSYTVYNAGWLEFTGDLYNCSGVSQIQQSRIVTAADCGGQTPTVANHCAAGWWDGSEYSRGLSGNHPVTPYANGDLYTINITSGAQHAQAVWRVAPWCGGGTHNIVTQFIYRIKATGGIYGPWHYAVSGAGYNIVC